MGDRGKPFEILSSLLLSNGKMSESKRKIETYPMKWQRIANDEGDSLGEYREGRRETCQTKELSQPEEKVNWMSREERNWKRAALFCRGTREDDMTGRKRKRRERSD